MDADYDNIAMNSVLDEVVNILTECKAEIQANMEAKGINASGRTSGAIEVERNENRVRLIIKAGKVAPLGTLEVGRAGGKVPLAFSSIIEQWAKDKGLQFQNAAEMRRFSYLTARKIASRGTRRHTENKEVYSQAVLAARAKMKESVKATLTEYIHTKLNEINNG